MANTRYPYANQLFLSGSIDMTSDDIRVILIDVADYTYSSAHDFLDDVAVAARVATSGALAGKSVTSGIFDATDVTLAAVVGDQCEAMIIYKHTGVEATSPLIAYIDSATNLPVTPDGSNIDIVWDNGANKIFKL